MHAVLTVCSEGSGIVVVAALFIDHEATVGELKRRVNKVGDIGASVVARYTATVCVDRNGVCETNTSLTSWNARNCWY